MKTTRMGMALVVVAGLAFFAGRGFGDDEGQGQPSPDEMEKMMRELATPGPQHKSLEKLVGTWDVKGRMWMAPDTDPIESQGTAKQSLILGGRFLVQDYEGEMMGEPYQGHGITGFDNFKKEWWTVWMDNWGTMYLPLSGPDAAAGKPVEMKGAWDSPMGSQACRSISTIVSDDEHKFEMYGEMAPGQGEMKMFELVYTRHK